MSITRTLYDKIWDDHVTTRSDEAEREGQDNVFRTAGFEWREPGCSMCIGMNGDVRELLG